MQVEVDQVIFGEQLHIYLIQDQNKVKRLKGDDIQNRYFKGRAINYDFQCSLWSGLAGGEFICVEF